MATNPFQKSLPRESSNSKIEGIKETSGSRKFPTLRTDRIHAIPTQQDETPKIVTGAEGASIVAEKVLSRLNKNKKSTDSNRSYPDSEGSSSKNNNETPIGIESTNQENKKESPDSIPTQDQKEYIALPKEAIDKLKATQRLTIQALKKSNRGDKTFKQLIRSIESTIASILFKDNNKVAYSEDTENLKNLMKNPNTPKNIQQHYNNLSLIDCTSFPSNDTNSEEATAIIASSEVSKRRKLDPQTKEAIDKKARIINLSVENYIDKSKEDIQSEKINLNAEVKYKILKEIKTVISSIDYSTINSLIRYYRNTVEDKTKENGVHLGICLRKMRDYKTGGWNVTDEDQAIEYYLHCQKAFNSNYYNQTIKNRCKNFQFSFAQNF